jgi:HAD superfamily phosphoserine phosphatase-like hydrolase
MRGAWEVEEANEVHEVKESKGVTAFFDLDGTLVALPSLERRFFQALRYRRAIPARSYFLWPLEALRLLPRGISAMFEANKMYLRGVQIPDGCGERDDDVSSWHKDGHQAEGQASASPPRNPRWPVPTFFAQAIERVAWHGRQGHEIVLVSGTLDPLARGAARALEAGLAACGIAVTIRVFATLLEERDGMWTGRILGKAMSGEAKARAAKGFAKDRGLDLKRCYAYGDSLNDRWLMESVGWPVAVNPSNDLRSIARNERWPVVCWNLEKDSTQKLCWPRSSGRRKNSEARPHSDVPIRSGVRRD